jgi:hypothetical protein
MLVFYALILTPLGVFPIRAIRAPVADPGPIPDPDLPRGDPYGDCLKKLRDLKEELDECKEEQAHLRERLEEYMRTLEHQREINAICYRERTEQYRLANTYLTQVTTSTAIINNLYNINADLRARILRLEAREEEDTEMGCATETCGTGFRHSELKKKRKKELIEDDPLPLPKKLEPIVEFL